MTLIKWNELVLPEEDELAKSRLSETYRVSLIERCIENGDKLEELTLNITIEDLNASSYTELSFTAWSDNFVYFPAMYDGDYWVESVPRNPCDFRTKPVGNG